MSDLISRADLFNELATVKASPEANEYKAEVYTAIKSLPSAEPKAVECSGCKCLGSYESEFPCVNCVRITKDYYCGARMRGVDDEHTV